MQRPVLAQSDVWSLGGVASEALVWATSGNEGRSSYQIQRTQQTDNTHFRGGYHDGCFHDGSRRLERVGLCHQMVVTALSGGLTNTSPVSQLVNELILSHMLQAALNRRLPGKEVYVQWEERCKISPHHIVSAERVFACKCFESVW